MRYEIRRAEEVPGKTLEFDIPEGAIILRFLTMADFGRNEVEYLVPAFEPVNITVNGKKFVWDRQEIGYEDVAQMAGVPTMKILWTVSYSGRILGNDRGQYSGSLVPGEKTQAREGMIFDVADTSRA